MGAPEPVHPFQSSADWHGESMSGFDDPKWLAKLGGARPDLRAAIDAMADSLNALDAALDDTHPEGDGCEICNVADELPGRWLAVVDASRPIRGDRPDLRSALWSIHQAAHDQENDETWCSSCLVEWPCPTATVLLAATPEPTLDAERLASVLHQSLDCKWRAHAGFTAKTDDDYHRKQADRILARLHERTEP